MTFVEYGTKIQGTENSFVIIGEPTPESLEDEEFEILKEILDWDIQINNWYTLDFVIPKIKQADEKLNDPKSKYWELDSDIAFENIICLTGSVVESIGKTQEWSAQYRIEGPFEPSQIYIRFYK